MSNIKENFLQRLVHNDDLISTTLSSISDNQSEPSTRDAIVELGEVKSGQKISHDKSTRVRYSCLRRKQHTALDVITKWGIFFLQKLTKMFCFHRSIHLSGSGATSCGSVRRRLWSLEPWSVFWKLGNKKKNNIYSFPFYIFSPPTYLYITENRIAEKSQPYRSLCIQPNVQ